MRTHYLVVGVATDATREEIRDAYWARARVLHPDANPTVDTTTEFSELATAYHVIYDRKARMKYDNLLRITLDRCTKCSGIGFTYGTRSNRKKPCQACEGAGFKEKEKRHARR